MAELTPREQQEQWARVTARGRAVQNSNQLKAHQSSDQAKVRIKSQSFPEMQQKVHDPAWKATQEAKKANEIARLAAKNQEETRLLQEKMVVDAEIQAYRASLLIKEAKSGQRKR